VRGFRFCRVDGAGDGSAADSGWCRFVLIVAGWTVLKMGLWRAFGWSWGFMVVWNALNMVLALFLHGVPAFFRGVCGWMEIAMELPLLLFLRGSGNVFGSPAEEDEISTAALTARCWVFRVFAGWIGKVM
jgi:hypothetical protein